jgi:DNA-binding transcriptional MerR regulator
MKTKNPTTAVLRHAERLLALIPPNLALSAGDLEDLESLIGVALNRVKGIRAGLFTVENAPKLPSEEQLRAVMDRFQPPSPEQRAELERLNKGPTRSDRKRYSSLAARRTRLEKKLQCIELHIREIRPLLDEGTRRDEQQREKSSVLDSVVRTLVERGLKPAEISHSLHEMFGGSPMKSRRAGTSAFTSVAASGRLEEIDDPLAISAESLGEKAVNARLFRLRAKGFKQPVSPTAKRRRTKT